jgi:hypothetical protein
MLGAEKTGFLVHVTDGTEVTTQNLEICVLANIVLGHFEHTEVEICDWAERATGDQHDWSLVRIAERAGEPMVRKLVVRRIREVLRRTSSHSRHGRKYMERGKRK